MRGKKHRTLTAIIILILVAAMVIMPVLSGLLAIL